MSHGGLPLRVMVLGDSPATHANDPFWSALLADGMSADFTSDMAACLEQVKRGGYGAAVLDLNAPGRSLMELRALRGERPELPVVVLIDATDSMVGHWVVKHGAAACLDRKYYNGAAARHILEQVAAHAAQRA
ncbi:MAG: hypothetical protein GC162_12695 [Planctomycetes bacterium]|nr:hypothetical protein [Planctomycetota bacterium]